MNIDAIWAEEVLRERRGSLTSDQLYNLVLLATGDPWQAADERADRIMEEMRSRRD